MKKYARHKTLEEIKADCLNDGFELNTEKHDQGSDWITITGTFAGQECTIIYAPFNGRFIGKLDNDKTFSERNTEFDNVDWYAEILDFLFVPAEAA